MAKRVTIKDIAKEVGVTASTVSCILNKKGLPFKQETVEKVMQTAKDLGYVANMAAVNLVKGETNTIGVLFIGNTDEPFNNAFVFGIISSLANTINKSNYNLYFSSSVKHSSEEELREHVNEMFNSGKVDGVVIIGPPESKYHSFFKSFLPSIPFVLIGRVEGTRRMNMVDADNYEIGFQAVRRLHESGASRIGLCLAELTRQFDVDRLEGAKAAAEKYGIELNDDSIIVSSEINPDHLKSTVNNLLPKIDGVYSWDSPSAFFILDSARSEGLYPDKLNIIIDEHLIDYRAFGLIPDLVAIDTRRIGELAAQLIQEKVKDESTSFSQVFIPPLIKIGEEVV